MYRYLSVFNQSGDSVLPDWGKEPVIEEKLHPGSPFDPPFHSAFNHAHGENGFQSDGGVTKEKQEVQYTFAIKSIQRLVLCWNITMKPFVLESSI